MNNMRFKKIFTKIRKQGKLFLFDYENKIPEYFKILT